MSWNYRVVESKTDKETYYSIRGVYYNDKGEADGWGRKPQYPIGETLEDLKKEVKHFQEALSKPILNEKELEKKFYKNLNEIIK